MGTKKQHLWDLVGAYPICSKCGSSKIIREASAAWSVAGREWQLNSIIDEFSCQGCNHDGVPDWTLDEAFRTARIRRLNDELRHGHAMRASIVMTSGVQAGGDAFVQAAVQAVSAFDAFTEDNDPHGEHDFGSFDIEGEKLFFKIDYFDPEMQRHSDDAANPEVTHRVLTIMLASEY